MENVELPPLGRQPEKKKEKKITRRTFLKYGGLLLATLIAGALGYKVYRKLKGPQKEKGREEESKGKLEIWLEYLRKIENFLKKIEENNKVDEQRIKNLEEFKKSLKEQANFSILARAYLKGELARLWDKKIQLAKTEGTEKNVETLENLKKGLIEEYETRSKGYTNLESFEEYIKYCILQTFGVLDFESLFTDSRINLNENQEKLFVELINNSDFLEIFERTLLGIIIVEICYIFKDKPEKNREVLDYLLNKHGLRFICSLPAIYDARISFGPFQLTDLVIGKKKGLFYPINFMNKFIVKIDENLKEKYSLPSYLLPESMEDLRMREHFIAEILMLIYYLIILIKTMDVGVLNACLQGEKRKWFLKQLSYFFAGSHHLPFATIRNFRDFLNNKENIEKERDFLNYLKELDKVKRSQLLITYLERLNI